MKNLDKLAAVAIAAFTVTLTPGVHAQATMDPNKMDGMKTQAAPASDMTDGEVRKVDKDAGKLTLKHGDIKSLDMPGMTMVFGVKDKAMLDKLAPGDKIKFKVVNDAGKFTVTEIAPAK